MTNTNSKRHALDVIAEKLTAAARDRTSNVVKIGALLNEAKDLVTHGEWLPWLKSHRDKFSFSQRTARNYMAAADFVKRRDIKSATVANLTPSAIYRLCEYDQKLHQEDQDDLPDPDHLTADDYSEIIDKALRIAETRHVDEFFITCELSIPYTRMAREREDLRHKEKLKESERSRIAQDEIDRAEANDILNDILKGEPEPIEPPPDEGAVEEPPQVFSTTEPASEPEEIKTVLEILHRLRTKSLKNLIAAKLDPERLRAAADFLNEIADAIAVKNDASDEITKMPLRSPPPNLSIREKFNQLVGAHFAFNGRPLSKRVVRVLAESGILTPEQLLAMDEREIAKIPNIGKEAIAEIAALRTRAKAGTPLPPPKPRHSNQQQALASVIPLQRNGANGAHHEGTKR